MKIVSCFNPDIIIKEVPGDTLAQADLTEAYLTWANLSKTDLIGANLTEANLAYADLSEANLTEANLSRANLTKADLTEANLNKADLTGSNLIYTNLIKSNFTDANLSGATLTRANLTGATFSDSTIMPDGRTWKEYQQDPLAGICHNQEVRRKAIEAWGNHSWEDCPMHAAFGWNNMTEVPEEQKLLVGCFISVFDAELLNKPKIKRN